MVDNEQNIGKGPEGQDQQQLVVGSGGAESGRRRRRRKDLLSRQQEVFLFRNRAARPSHLLSAPEFTGAINSDNQEQMIHLFAVHPTVDDIIFACNQLLASSAAKRLNAPALTMEEKLDAARDGILVAINKFDPERGTRFSTLAVYQLRSEIYKAEREKLGIKDIEYTSLRKARYVKGIFAEAYGGREPKRDELNRQLLANTQITLKNIDTVLDIIYGQSAAPPVSIYRPFGPYSKTLEDIIAEQSDGTEFYAMSETDRGFVRTAIRRLSIPEQEIIARVFYQRERILPEGEELLDRALSNLREDPVIQAIAMNYIPGYEPPLPQKPKINSLSTDEQLNNTSDPAKKLAILVIAGTEKDEICQILDITPEQFKSTMARARGRGFFASDSLTEDEKEGLTINAKLLIAKYVHEKVAILYNAGLEEEEICQRLNIKRRRFVEHLKKAKDESLIVEVEIQPEGDLEAQLADPRLTSVQKVALLTEAGWKRKAIAERLDLTPGTVTYYKGLAKKAHLIDDSKRLRDVQRMLDDGMSVRAIAQELGLNKSTVQEFITKERAAGNLKKLPDRKKLAAEAVDEATLTVKALMERRPQYTPGFRFKRSAKSPEQPSTELPQEGEERVVFRPEGTTPTS